VLATVPYIANGQTVAFSGKVLWATSAAGTDNKHPHCGVRRESTGPTPFAPGNRVRIFLPLRNTLGFLRVLRRPE
jgi:hypothetical protein